jgi:YjbR
MIRAGGFDGMTAGSRASRGNENEGKNRNMASGKDLRRMARALAGTTEAPHFDRAAFKVARIYVTLAADERTANFKFTPDEQEFKCMLAPEAFAPVPGGWGRQGWTTATLAAMSAAELQDALATAWRHAVARRPRR